MPLTKNESKKILLNAFRLALAVSEKRTDDATVAYSNILDSALSQGSDSDDDMPTLISLGKPESNIKLVISEIEQQQQNQAPFAFASGFTALSPEGDSDYHDEALVEEFGQEKSDTEVPVDDEESVAEEAEEVEEEIEESVSEEEEEVEELELEPVRIKKVIYWKDSKSGDIYVCLPEDEVGDKVGRYVDGKPVFD